MLVVCCHSMVWVQTNTINFDDYPQGTLTYALT
jgi:hypothetical protein